MIAARAGVLRGGGDGEGGSEMRGRHYGDGWLRVFGNFLFFFLVKVEVEARSWRR